MKKNISIAVFSFLIIMSCVALAQENKEPASAAIQNSTNSNGEETRTPAQAFWLAADEEIRMIPQAAPKNIVDESYVEPAAPFTHYDGVPVPIVPPRSQELAFYPCSQCHENWPTNETPRALAPVHEVALNHGEGRIWCLTCHDPENRDKLHTVRGDEVDFNDSWKVCGQCHANRQKDWYFGAHGKRAYFWEGEVVRYNCTHCHNPHRPPFMHQKPQPKPPIRAGLEPMKPKDKHARLRVWERSTSAKARGGETVKQEKNHE